MSQLSRRRLLQLMGGTAVAAPFAQLLGTTPAWALSGRCERVIFFYFPDGVPGVSSNGDPTAWHATGNEHDFQVPDAMGGVGSWRDECLFFRGLSMGGTDAGSHPGGAKKLLTASDGGGGQSIDQFLAQSAGAGAPWRHLYLGAMANHNGASGDKHIVYPTGGSSISPQDNPRQAFSDLFGVFTPQPSQPGSTPTVGDDASRRRRSLLDAMLGDLNDLRGKLGTA